MSAAVGGFRGLRALAGCGGCAAKAPPELVDLLTGFAARSGGQDPNVLVGLAPFDDAAVYAIDADRALIATVDFFPPLVDAPRDYGAIAAANAVSDVYAMGGEVAFALAVSGFPAEVPPQVIADVTAGAVDVLADCGALLLGGHSVRCAEPVFGLAVLGFVDPARIWRKSGAREGDVLMLSKPLGSGLLLSSGRPEELATATDMMRRTNRAAAQALRALPQAPRAVTDVSGYGLLGHALEIAVQSGVVLDLDTAALPCLPAAIEAAARGVRTSAHRAASDVDARVRIGAGVAACRLALLHDPQTSGGLLAAVDAGSVGALRAAGYVPVGTIRTGGDGGVELR
ncbi:MAG: selenide, water dikinase SelD [Steroidobacteraceae bacterium]